MIRKFLLVLIFLKANLGIAQATSDKWIGMYKNQESEMELTINRSKEGVYSGAFNFKGQLFSIRGASSLNKFAGEYQYGSNWYPFFLTPFQQSFILSVDGVNAYMQKLKKDSSTGSSQQSKSTGNESTALLNSSASYSWISQLKGKQLIFLETKDGGTMKVTLSLMVNGRFSYLSTSSYSSGGFSQFSYTNEDKDFGTWTIREKDSKILLVLTSEKDGQTTLSAINQGVSRDQILLNGKRFFITQLN